MGRYLATLRDRIENDLSLIDDLQIESKFGSKEPWEGIYASRPVWSKAGGEFAGVWFTHNGKAKGWAVNVYFELERKDAKRLRKRLRRCRDLPGKECCGQYIWYHYLDKYKDWSPLLPRLHRETEDPGQMTKYLSDQLTTTVKAAAPIIDQFLETS